MRSLVAHSFTTVLLGAGSAAAQTSAAFPDVHHASPTRAAAPASAPSSPAPSPNEWVGPQSVGPTVGWAAPGSGASGSATTVGGAAPEERLAARSAWLPATATPRADAGWEPEEAPSSGTRTVGALFFAIPYAAGLGIAASEGFANSSGWLAAPLLGPWLALSGRHDPCDRLDARRDGVDQDIGRCVAEPMVRGLLVLDGVLQATGAVLLVIGGPRERRLVRREVTVGARPVGSGWGLGAQGAF